MIMDRGVGGGGELWDVTYFKDTVSASVRRESVNQLRIAVTPSGSEVVSIKLPLRRYGAYLALVREWTFSFGGGAFVEEEY